MDDVLKQVLELAKKEANLEVLWLYGSRAKGTAHENSDYDLAIAQTGVEDRIERADIADEMAYHWRQNLGLHENQLSIIDINSAPITLAYGVSTTGKVVYCKNPRRLAREENRISGMWEDYLYLKKA